ncbi:MAG: lysine-2,3-aminomutase-like protein [Methylocystis sp.]
MTERPLHTIDDLAAAGLVTPSQALRAVADRYAIALTPQIATLVDRADPDDPIARQFLPDARELEMTPAELADPIGDEAHSPVPGVVHRYTDRVLLKLVSVCPVYCRFCFRRESLGKSGALDSATLARALDYIGAHAEISEVILTGGDPLAASSRRLRAVAGRLSATPHVTRLRVHTRVPIAAPDLVTVERLAALRAARKTLVVALHVNHARELSPGAEAAIERLKDAGVKLLSQTVLLKGVNDDAAALDALLRALAALGVEPYYLHHPDLAKGTARFRLSLTRGQEIYEALAKLRVGAPLPRYVLDLPGGFGKIPIEAPHLTQSEDGSWRARDRFGVEHRYEECFDASREEQTP